MDTKLKSYNLNSPAGVGYGIAWVSAVLFTVATVIGISIIAMLVTVKNWNLYPESYGYFDENDNFIQYESEFTGEITNPNFNEFISLDGILTILCAVLALLSLIVILILTGRFNRKENGEIRLNWFDKIWSELHLCAVAGFPVGIVALSIGLYYLWASENWFGVFEPKFYSEDFYDIPNDLMLVLICSGLIASTILTYASFVSVVKKIKGHQFWEKSLIGGLFLVIYRGIKGSKKTLWKVLGILTVGAFLSATWFGLPIVLILMLIFIPKQVKKYYQVCEGLEQVNNGNLAYKIPVEADAKGVMGEFDRLAAGINEISAAQSIAVQNEIKNQRMKTELISNVSHDLKTPLTSMVTYIDLLKQEGLNSPNAPEYLEIIDSKTQRLRKLTENLFEAAKASSGAIPVNIEQIDMGSLISQSLAEMDEKLEKRRLTVYVKNQCEDGCKVMADGQLLWRVIENLLGNISKYALEGSRVYINMSKIHSVNPSRRSKILLEVKNISAEQLNISADELTERFKRGDESRNTEGSGLGLAIAKDLVHLMNGVFQVTIDGDLFKACVLLEEAGPAGAEEQRESAPKAEVKKEGKEKRNFQENSARKLGELADKLKKKKEHSYESPTSSSENRKTEEMMINKSYEPSEQTEAAQSFSPETEADESEDYLK